MKPLLNHTSKETAYKVENYPWGFRLRTTKFYWIETEAKKGDRFCTMTIDPKTGKECAVKKGVYSPVLFMYLDEKSYVQCTGFSIYSNRAEVEKFIQSVGGVDILNPEQRKQFNSMMGINEVKRDEFTGTVKKDFSVKWERETIGQGWKDGVWNNGEKGEYDEVKITFDRPDGVSLKEMLKAMKSLNQVKLNEVFKVRSYGRLGEHAGTVRICVRGGVMLGTISEDTYKNYLASDTNVIEEEKI